MISARLPPFISLAGCWRFRDIRNSPSTTHVPCWTIALKNCPQMRWAKHVNHWPIRTMAVWSASGSASLWSVLCRGPQPTLTLDPAAPGLSESDPARRQDCRWGTTSSTDSHSQCSRSASRAALPDDEFADSGCPAIYFAPGLYLNLGSGFSMFAPI